MKHGMHQPNRLAQGGLINRRESLHFSFNGKTLEGYAGDTLASALLANGVEVVSRSFKYHRPRGIFTAGEEEPNALIEIGEGNQRVPTCRAPEIPLRQGLVANSQNCWPSVNLDAGRIIDFTHALWPAGFYNKTFKWPSWHTWENLIRHSAGLGRPLTEPDPDHYEQVNAHCDLLICGGGPAGLIAALTAGRMGARVMLVDQGETFGGALNWEQVVLDGVPGHDWARQTADELSTLSNVTLLPRTTVAGNYDHNVTTLLQTGTDTAWRECFWTVRPKNILLATGAIEQGLIFPNNDRPGIMLAGAVRHYANRYAVAAGKQVIIATTNDTAYQTAIDLARHEVRVAAIIDSRQTISEDLTRRMTDLGTVILANSRIGNHRHH